METTMTCPCNRTLANGAFSCMPCQAKAAGRLNVDRSGGGATRTQTSTWRLPTATGFDFDRLTKGALVGSPLTKTSGTLLDDLASYATFSPDVLNVIGAWQIDTRALAHAGRSAPGFVRTAVHEGGHAICCHALHVQIKSVNPGPNEGMVWHDGVTDPAKNLLISVAGAMAEQFAVLPEYAPARGLCGQDAVDVDGIFARLGITDQGTRHRAIDAAGAVVKGILIDHAPGWHALIWGLCQHPEQVLDGAMIHRIIATGDLSSVGW